jgi:hypothetical protein
MFIQEPLFSIFEQSEYYESLKITQTPFDLVLISFPKESIFQTVEGIIIDGKITYKELLESIVKSAMNKYTQERSMIILVKAFLPRETSMFNHMISTVINQFCTTFKSIHSRFNDQKSTTTISYSFIHSSDHNLINLIKKTQIINDKPYLGCFELIFALMNYYTLKINPNDRVTFLEGEEPTTPSVTSISIKLLKELFNNQARIFNFNENLFNESIIPFKELFNITDDEELYNFEIDLSKIGLKDISVTNYLVTDENSLEETLIKLMFP